MKSPIPTRHWVLLLLGLSLTGLLAWAGVSLLGKADTGLTGIEENSGEGESLTGEGGSDERTPLKGLGGLPLDEAGARDLQVKIEILERLSEEDDGGEAGLALLRLQSVRVGKPMPFQWRIEAGPDAGRSAGSQGEELLQGLEPGWYLLSLSGPGGARAPRLLQLHADAESTIRVDWTHAGRVRGRIYDPQGQAVGGAHVQIGEVQGKTDGDGRFELSGLWPGQGLPLLIEAEGLASRVEPIGVVASSEPPRELRFVLEEAAEVEGVVSMPRHEWKHARIFVLPGRPSGRNGNGRGYAHLPLFWKDRFSDLRLDENGRFRIRGVSRALPLALGFVHPRYRLESPHPLFVIERSGKAREQVVLQPVAMRVLTGKVTAKDGKPVQAQLEMRGKGRWGDAYFRGGVRPPLTRQAAWMGSSVTASDASGHYSMGVPGRGAVLHVQAPGYSSLREPAPKAGSADLELSAGSDAGAAMQTVLRLRFKSEVTEQGKVRALRLHVRREGQAAPAQGAKGPALIDPRNGYELQFEGPTRIRLSVSEPGAAKPLFDQTLDLRSARSLTIQ
jgi:Carboxypeptidase regulatory-like domain